MRTKALWACRRTSSHVVVVEDTGEKVADDGADGSELALELALELLDDKNCEPHVAALL